MNMLDWVEGTHNSPMFTTHDVVVFLDGLEQSDNMIDKWHMYMMKDGCISFVGLNLAIIRRKI
jgi:hypothetical protein